MDKQIKIQEIVDDFLAKGFGERFKVEYTLLSDTEIKIDITGNGVSYLIGQYGKTLLAFQHIIRQIYIHSTGDFNEEIKLIIDVDGYKAKRTEKIKDIAKNAAEKCLELNAEIKMPTMNPYERHVVHEFVQENYPSIQTLSVGEEPNRRILLKPVTVAN